MTFDQKTIDALAWLREGWNGDNSEQAIIAFSTLDNAGVFAALDEQTDYTSAEEILAESAAISLSRAGMDIDPAEWGDTTRADMARHQGYTAASRLGKLERVPGTDTLRPARDDVAPHEHVYTKGHPGELCLYGSCTLTYAEFKDQIYKNEGPAGA